MNNFDPKNSDHVGALWLAEQQMKEGKKPLTHVHSANVLAQNLYGYKYKRPLDSDNDLIDDKRR